MSIRIILCGKNGRMGRAVAEQCSLLSDTYTIVAGVDVANADYADIRDCNVDADVILDFSHHTMTQILCEYAVARQLPLVIATTGQTAEEKETMERAAEKTAVFASANMSLGVSLLVALAKKAAAVLTGADIEIIERHHNKKCDAPSGTALMIADGIKSVRTDSEYVYDRHSVKKPRSENEIGIHSVRAGNIVGDHEVLFALDNEIITLSHSASSRKLFADGALRACGFMCGKSAGMYSMSDLLDSII